MPLDITKYFKDAFFLFPFLPSTFFLLINIKTSKNSDDVNLLFNFKWK